MLLDPQYTYLGFMHGAVPTIHQGLALNLKLEWKGRTGGKAREGWWEREWNTLDWDQTSMEGTKGRAVNALIS